MDESLTNGHSADLEVLFERALGLAPAERSAYLAGACGSDLKLQERLEALLCAHEAAGGFLPERPAGQTALLLPVTEKPGDRIGRYKLLQQIGEGGCGVVYMAEQEEPLRRRVALKIIKLGMDTKSVIARFEAERQALALMDHPNVAKVLDAGATEAGRSYFVMELVQGIKITKFCDDNSLSAEERLTLFVQVCHAIQHAHQKGIIHRDIKPSNILVTQLDGQAVPKVIDFGIAKATGGQVLTDKTLFTAFQQFIGTPAYMSPEQAELSASDVDTRSDIYALGVLLYELLTGKTPFDSKDLFAAGLDGMRRALREQEPARPSTRLNTLPGEELTTTAKRRRTEPPKLIHLVRGDLDWIVMKCLEKDRGRRYETANGLAADLERHLKHESVEACPPSTAYRVQKFLRRNAVMVTAGAAVTAALVLGTALSTWQAVRASRLRMRAEANERKALAAQAGEANQRRLAQDQELLARQHAYAADVNIANTAWRENNLGQAMTALRRQLPGDGETDLRDIAWRYLWHKCQGQQAKTFQHDAEVISADMSRDGRWLATASGGAFWIWDTSREEQRRLLSSGASRDIGLRVGDHLAFDPKGRYLATATSSEILIWSIPDWGKVQRLAVPNASVGFSGDGTTLAAFGDQGVQIWKSVTWETLVRPGQIEVTNPANCRLLALNRDGSLLALVWQNTWRRDNLAIGEVSLWKLPQCEPLYKSGEIKDGAAVAFSDDDRWLAVCTTGPPSVVWLWTLGPGIFSPPFQEPQCKLSAQWLASPRLGRALAFASGGKVLATAGSDHVIHLWDIGPTNGSPTLLRGHLNEIFSLRFAADGQLVSASEDKTACLWNLKEAKPTPRVFSIPPGRLVCAQNSDANRMITVNLTALTFEQWDMETGQVLREKSIQNGDTILQHGRFLDGTPLSKSVVANNYIYDPGATNGDLRYLGPVPPCPSSLAWHLTASIADGDFYAWNAESGELVYSNQFSPRLLVACPVAEPKKLLLLEEDGGALSIYDPQTHHTEQIEEHVPMSPPVWKASPDGRLFTYLTINNQVKVYEPATKQTKLVVKVPDLSLPIVTSEFSPDSRWLAVATWGGQARVWDIATGRPVGGPFPRYSADSWKVGFSPDGKSLVAYSLDNTARVWNIATGREVISGLPLNGFLNFHMYWQFLSRDGNSVLEGVGEQALRIVRVPALGEIDALEKSQAKGR